MASPLKSGKQSVRLGAPVRASRIRRDPPPIAKKVVERDPSEQDAWTVVVGVVAFALAIAIIIIGFSSWQAASSGDDGDNLVIEL